MSETAKSKAQELYETLWASPVFFAVASSAVFIIGDTPRSERLAWYLYAAGWVPLVVMTAFALVTRRRPPTYALAAGIGSLLLFGVFHLALYHDSMPF
ncbi:hypothetical protein [Streptomyces anandii]|uniref:hypothetical protein n=1 Tax=Streptomyces anandii TaxID=285454 RepID=UPI0036C0CD76